MQTTSDVHENLMLRSFFHCASIHLWFRWENVFDDVEDYLCL